MELADAIRDRRSIRSFRSDPVPAELVRKILSAGTQAPSAKNGQRWRFPILRGESKERFIEMFRSELKEFIESLSREESDSTWGHVTSWMGPLLTQ
jgi:nitroreductase